MIRLLGGAARYAVRFHWRGGAQLYWQPRQLGPLRWTRVTDNPSVASVLLPKPPRHGIDWGKLGELQDWAHETSIYRGDELVWQGPVRQVTESTSSVLVEAVDVVGWLDRLPNQLPYTLTGDLATIASAIITNGLAADDPNIGAHVQATATGVVAERVANLPESVMVGNELRELARNGLDFTTVGRRLILGPEAMPTQAAARLTSAHFASDLQVIRAGGDTVTRAIVIGEGVKGTAGGVDPHRGLLAKIVKADGTLTTAAATARAASLVAAARPPLLVVKVPDGATLRPTAPVAMRQLVCGQRIDVAVEGYALPAEAALRLSQVAVDYDNERGERVAVSLAPVGGTDGGTG